MKPISLLSLFAVTVISLFGCKKNNNVTPASVVGKWNLTKYEVKEYVNSSLKTNSDYAPSNSYIQLNSDNTGYVSEPINIAPFSPDSITYTFSNPNLTVKFSSGYAINYIITSISTNNMILETKGGVVNNSQVVVNYYYSK